jgi:hypothetical protein
VPRLGCCPACEHKYLSSTDRYAPGGRESNQRRALRVSGSTKRSLLACPRGCIACVHRMALMLADAVARRLQIVPRGKRHPHVCLEPTKFLGLWPRSIGLRIVVQSGVCSLDETLGEIECNDRAYHKEDRTEHRAIPIIRSSCIAGSGAKVDSAETVRWADHHGDRSPGCNHGRVRRMRVAQRRDEAQRRGQCGEHFLQSRRKRRHETATNET